ncbi:1331_t:CDS:1 [Acaulospora colombiana]|uniref:1331_t:CDS:1 n=1 Tax=Acaulospora colombiana TaxID=27376 RepID=A0ACA9KH35_9GLOM|nr:1331_t:CDS:1 [Acaulospora colombiana]
MASFNSSGVTCRLLIIIILAHIAFSPTIIRAETPPPLPIPAHVPVIGENAQNTPAGIYSPEMSINKAGAFLPGGGAILAAPMPQWGDLPVIDSVGGQSFINPNNVNKRRGFAKGIQ